MLPFEPPYPRTVPDRDVWPLGLVEGNTLAWSYYQFRWLRPPRSRSCAEWPDFPNRRGFRGDGSTPVPLPPPAWPQPSILCTRLSAISPILAAISDLSSGPLFDGV